MPQAGKPITGPLDDATRRQYVDHLIGSLEHGLWMREQAVAEVTSTKFAMTCFTEWSLNESTGHTQRYGRLGFGFPKRWVIARGGQPVTYFRDVRNSVYAEAVRSLERSATDAESRRRNEILLGFVKPLRPQRQERAAPKEKKTPTPRTRRATTFVRQWSNTMPFLEEREWRIIEPVLREVRPAVPFQEGRNNRPKIHLPYEPGTELFTIVLPDNETVALALDKPEVRRALAAPGRLHVTVLSLEDVGTM